MMDWGMVVCVSAAVTAVILSLAMPKKARGKVMSISLAFAGVTGTILYGLGYASLNIPFGAALVRSVLAVCRMFLGASDLGSVQDAECFQHSWVVVLFWLAHFVGFYITASAVLSALGSKLLQKIRLALSWRGELLLIYGVQPQAADYAQSRVDAGHCTVVFSGGVPDEDTMERINRMGGIVYSDEEKHFLRKIGMRRGARKMELAALSEDRDANLTVARKLLESLREHGITSDQTRLLISGIGDDTGMTLQAREGKYGYGSVFTFDQYELAARQLVRLYPPCDLIEFDAEGRAKTDLRVLLIGFGRTGRAILRHLVMNGQFPGSHFRADVFDPACAQTGGAIFGPGSPAMSEYDIRFHPDAAGGTALFQFLREEGDGIQLILLCSGNEKKHRELEDDLRQWYESRDVMPKIIHCTKEAVFEGSDAASREALCTQEVLNLNRMDRMAMEINHVYQGEGESAWDQWMRCDYFSRMSCRAAADFYPAVLRASGRSGEEILSGQNWPPEPKMLQTLGEMEHARWCAFHYMMGYAPMSREEFDRRMAEAQKGTLKEKPGKDARHKRHICLMPWEALPELSAHETKITGRKVDYQQMDIDNVLILPRVLKAAGEK